MYCSVVCTPPDISSIGRTSSRATNRGGGDIDPRANRLLRGLSDAEFDRLRSDLEPVRLPRPTELESANEEVKFVYFPTSGVASIVAIDESGGPSIRR